MTSQVKRIVSASRAICYDGENAKEVISIFGSLTAIIHQGELFIDYGFVEEKVNKGDWVVNERGNTLVMSEAEFHKNFEQYPEPKEIQRARCMCGKEYGIERDSDLTTRADRKRIFPIGEDEPGLCCFVCRDCDSDLTEVLPGGEYEGS